MMEIINEMLLKNDQLRVLLKHMVKLNDLLNKYRSLVQQMTSGRVDGSVCVESLETRYQKLVRDGDRIDLKKLLGEEEKEKPMANRRRLKTLRNVVKKRTAKRKQLMKVKLPTVVPVKKKRTDLKTGLSEHNYARKRPAVGGGQVKEPEAGGTSQQKMVRVAEVRRLFGQQKLVGSAKRKPPIILRRNRDKENDSNDVIVNEPSPISVQSEDNDLLWQSAPAIGEPIIEEPTTRSETTNVNEKQTCQSSVVVLLPKVATKLSQPVIKRSDINKTPVTNKTVTNKTVTNKTVTNKTPAINSGQIITVVNNKVAEEKRVVVLPVAFLEPQDAHIPGFPRILPKPADAPDINERYPCTWEGCDQRFPSRLKLDFHLNYHKAGVHKQKIKCFRKKPVERCVKDTDNSGRYIVPNSTRPGKSFSGIPNQPVECYEDRNKIPDLPWKQCSFPGCQLSYRYFTDRHRIRHKKLAKANGTFQQLFMKNYDGVESACDEPGCGYKAYGPSCQLRLKVHKERNHLQLKLFECDWPGCDKSFYDKQQWQFHLRRHTGERPEVCPWPGCGQRFRRMQYKHLKNHVKKLRKEKGLDDDSWDVEGSQRGSGKNIPRLVKQCPWPGCDKSLKLMMKHVVEHIKQMQQERAADEQPDETSETSCDNDSRN